MRTHQSPNVLLTVSDEVKLIDFGLAQTKEVRAAVQESVHNLRQRRPHVRESVRTSTVSGTAVRQIIRNATRLRLFELSFLYLEPKQLTPRRGAPPDRLELAFLYK